jgi:endogenous inhibitor of DNA gyrase (YacG/DUF329 family)
MAAVTCPTCGKRFDPALSQSMPFCSPRCRRIDLNRWLNEEIAVPYHESGQHEGGGREENDEDED